jgi:hypothetical protein
MNRRTHRARRGMGAFGVSVAMLAVALAALGAAVPEARGSGNSGSIEPDSAPRQRSRRWWLDHWSHSMQERLFVQWMNAQNGGTAWQLTMTPSQVNPLYAWWLQNVWPSL